MMKCFESILIASLIACLSACVPTPESQPETPDGEAPGSADETIPAVTVTVATEVTNEWERTPGGNPRLESSLAQLLDTYQKDGLAEAKAFAKAHQIVLENGRVQVVIVTTPEAIADIRQEIDTLGGEYEGHSQNLMQALVPLDALETLAQRPEIKMIRVPRRANP